MNSKIRDHILVLVAFCKTGTPAEELAILMDEGMDEILRSENAYDFLCEALDYFPYTVYLLSPKQKKAGMHYCPSWDYLLVGPKDPEMAACKCEHMKKWRQT